MSADIELFECGLRIENKYSSFMQSRNESEIDKYIETMKECCDKGKVVKMKKTYRCIDTTPLPI